MVTCPKCGSRLAEGSTTCPVCGGDASLWLAREGQTYGPYTLADLRQARAEGRLGNGDMVMVGTRGEWQSLGVVAPDLVTTSYQPPRRPTRQASKAAALLAGLLTALTVGIIVTILVANTTAARHQRQRRAVTTMPRPMTPGARPVTRTVPLKTSSG